MEPAAPLQERALCPLLLSLLSQHHSRAVPPNTASIWYCESWRIGSLDVKILSSLSVEYKFENWQFYLLPSFFHKIINSLSTEIILVICEFSTSFNILPMRNRTSGINIRWAVWRVFVCLFAFPLMHRPLRSGAEKLQLSLQRIIQPSHHRHRGEVETGTGNCDSYPMPVSVIFIRLHRTFFFKNFRKIGK